MRQFLDTAPLAADEQSSVGDSLKALRLHARAYRAGLSQESVWLFLSTVGCWGVPQPWFQLIAYLLTGWLFGELMRRHVRDAKSFTDLTNAIERRVHSETIDGASRAAQLLEITEFREQHLRSWKPYWASRVFIACWLFYVASIAYALIQAFFRHLSSAA